MQTHDASAWALLGLGAYHGLNPGMGWLFAVALGMQNKSRRAVWQTLLPLGIGHALAIAAALAVAAALGAVIPLGVLRWLTATVLVGFGIFKLISTRHPRWGSMRIGFGKLTFWSFLMASAHGAGLMLLPLVMRDAGTGGRCQRHLGHRHPYCRLPRGNGRGGGPGVREVRGRLHPPRLDQTSTSSGRSPC